MSEIVEPSGRSITDVAASLGVSRQVLSTLLNGHASLSADMALRFERQSRSVRYLHETADLVRSGTVNRRNCNWRGDMVGLRKPVKSAQLRNQAEA
jgi:hypothetical protein